VDSLEDNEFTINYDSNNFSYCSTPYSITNYDNFKIVSLIIILYISILTTICFITYFFFKLIEKLVDSFIYYKTYNHNLFFENRMKNLERIILSMNLRSSMDSL